MEKYINYKLGEFLLDDQFREWVLSGSVPEGTIWGDLLLQYPEKKQYIDEAIILVREWKRTESSLNDEQMFRDIQSILTDIDRRKTVLRPMWYGWVRYAAAVFIALGVAWYFYSNRETHRLDLATSGNSTNMIEITNSGQVDKVLHLPDSSVIRLSPGSRITYSSGFVHERMRDVNLTGAAFFEVRRNTLRPFSVYAGGLTTRVLGTSFFVKSSETDISVTVNTGKVAVSRSGEEAAPLILMPNQKAIYYISEPRLMKTLSEVPVMVEPGELKTGGAFDGAKAGDVFRILEKAYGISIYFDEQKMEDCYVTLPFREEPFYQKLDIICRTINATYRRTDDGIRVESEGCQ
ncbi:FecR family protein [Dyadobacter sp. CY323]|uniref:FecR family protein n=1 Tax=Dyadobacter sp. CY323 TaxID=2907302 RepID=UPI001F3FD2D9|nr:FecR family protein [Dyadobacter sp. CY323]MCE6989868.1 FecR domain-containing protein [Dyadobacter sp. CY323]